MVKQSNNLWILSSFREVDKVSCSWTIRLESTYSPTNALYLYKQCKVKPVQRLLQVPLFWLSDVTPFLPPSAQIHDTNFLTGTLKHLLTTCSTLRKVRNLRGGGRKPVRDRALLTNNADICYVSLQQILQPSLGQDHSKKSVVKWQAWNLLLLLQNDNSGQQ